jgi:hypothetical protein
MKATQRKEEDKQATRDPSSMRALRFALLLGIALNLGMIGVRVSLYPSFFRMPGSLTSISEPAILLILYGPLVIWATSKGGSAGQEVLLKGALLGLASGALEIAHISLENFGRLSPRAETISTGAFMLGLLALWGAAGYLAVRSASDVGVGILTGSWSAMVGLLLTVTFGFSQLYWALPRLERRDVGSPDFLRSGWADLHAFAIADVFEAGFKVLFVAPIAGAIFGGLGGVIAHIIPRKQDEPN